MKKNDFIRVIMVTAITFLTLPGCVYYKTFELNQTSSDALNFVHYYKNNVTISESGKKESNNQYIIYDFEIRNDTIFGFLELYQNKFHGPKKKYFRKKNDAPVKILHLYADSLPTNDTLIMPVSRITRATMHEIDYERSAFIISLGPAVVTWIIIWAVNFSVGTSF